MCDVRFRFLFVCPPVKGYCEITNKLVYRVEYLKRKEKGPRAQSTGVKLLAHLQVQWWGVSEGLLPPKQWCLPSQLTPVGTAA